MYSFGVEELTSNMNVIVLLKTQVVVAGPNYVP